MCGVVLVVGGHWQYANLNCMHNRPYGGLGCRCRRKDIPSRRHGGSGKLSSFRALHVESLLCESWRTNGTSAVSELNIEDAG